MQKFVTLCLMAAAALCLTTVAFADMVLEPSPTYALTHLLVYPIILILAVVVITNVALWLFRKKK